MVLRNIVSTSGQREFQAALPAARLRRANTQAHSSNGTSPRPRGGSWMSKELVISANRHETRVAVMEDDQVVEVYHQRENEYSLAGSIDKGRVTRVLPGMQSAFVDIGLGRDAFLYVSDFFEDNEEYDKIVTSVENKILKLDRTPGPQQQPIAEPASEEPAA